MNKNLFYRHFELDRAMVDKDARSVELAFSSETPVMRWFGSEILLHGRENVDLSRLKTMGSALFNHNPDHIVGPVKSPRIEDKKGRATIVFDQDDEGERAMQKVLSGSLRGVSVGYAINKFRELQKDEEWNGFRGPAYIATRWTPYEISLTPIPADASVGIGRDSTRSLEGIEIESSTNNNNQKEVHEMNEEQIRAMIQAAIDKVATPDIGEITKQVRAAIAEDNKPQFRISPEELVDLTGRAGAISPEAKMKAMDLYMEGKNGNEIRNAILDMAAKKPDAGDHGNVPPVGNTPPASTAQGRQMPYRKVEEVPDDVFDQMITDPNTMPLQ